MKFNLKNKPRNGENCGWDDYIPKAEEWFEGFEKELREILEKERWLYAEYLAKEILGE